MPQDIPQVIRALVNSMLSPKFLSWFNKAVDPNSKFDLVLHANKGKASKEPTVVQHGELITWDTLTE